MNYREIQGEYPKAFAELVFWMNNQPAHSGSTGYRIGKNGNLQSLSAYYVDGVGLNDRDLYDFFDENRIVIECYSDTLPNAVNFNILVRYVVNGSVWLYKPLGAFESRSDAELAAFIKCFSILETRIENMPTSPPLPLESDLGDAFAWGMP